MPLPRNAQGRAKPDPARDTTSLGWRVQQLRLARGWQQNELARVAGVDAASVNRLERGSKTSKPKPDTVNKLLDALHVTQAEREAVFHREPDPLAMDEIERVVQKFAAANDDAPYPLVLVDEHWYRRYANRFTMAIFELGDNALGRMSSEHLLAGLLDRASPMYPLWSDSDRRRLLEHRISAFKTLFAPQQFDRWYLDVQAFVTSFPEGDRAWHLQDIARPQFIHQHDAVISAPSGKRYKMLTQMNVLLEHPRFSVATMRPLDEETARNMEETRQKLLLAS